MKNEYNSYFFNEFYQENGGGSYMDSQLWVPFFAKAARKIVDLFNPTTVLDAGCACGYLVAALRDLGVEAYGIDVSKYAISNVREDVKDFCFVHSVTEPLPKEMPASYDLVICVEVLELLFPQDGLLAIENLCSYSDTLLFSATPNDIEDRTHVNVQLPEYWAELFYNHSFAKNFIFDMTILSPWCVVYERFSDPKKLIFNYELNMRIDKLINEKNINQAIAEVVESLLNVTSKVYFDEGNGFEEKKSLFVAQRLEDCNLLVNLRIPKNTTRIKFAPVEAQYCLLKNVEVYLDNEQVTNYHTNGEMVNNYLLFNNLEPHITIADVVDRGQLKITAKFQHVEEEFLQLYLGKNSKNDFVISELTKKIEEMDAMLSSKPAPIPAPPVVPVIAAPQIETISEEVAPVEDEITSVEEITAEMPEEVVAEMAPEVEEVSIPEPISTPLAAVLPESTPINLEALAEKDALLAEKEAIIAENERLLSEKDSALEELNTKLTLAESTVTRKEAQISEKDQLLSDKMGEVMEQTTALKEKDKELEEILEKQKEHDTVIEEKDKAIEDLEATLKEKDEKLQELEAAMAEKDGGDAEKEAELEEKTAALARVQEIISEKEAIIEGKENTLTQFEEKIRNTEEALFQKTQEFTKLDGRYKLIHEDYQNANKEIDSLADQLTQLQHSYDSMRNSSLWKMVAPFHKEGDDAKAADKKETKAKKEPKGKKEKEVKEPKAKKEKEPKEPKAKKEKEPKAKKEAKPKKEVAPKKKKKGEEPEVEEEFQEPAETMAPVAAVADEPLDEVAES